MKDMFPFYNTDIHPGGTDSELNQTRKNTNTFVECIRVVCFVKHTTSAWQIT
jgi:hypothetical protein